MPEQPVQPHWTLNLSNGLKVNVPADLDNPVTRQRIQPGLRLLDADTGLGLTRLPWPSIPIR